jgi:polysaccharide biosynthesis transport protein
VSVSATDPKPRVAALLANAFAAEYVNFRQEADRAKIDEARRRIDRQVRDLSPEDRAGERGRTLQSRAGQLRVLASLQTGNAEIVQAAKPPSSPSSPRPVRNGIVAGALALMLALAVAFLFERLDRKLRDPKEIEGIFRRPLLGAIPESRQLANGGPATEGLPDTTAEAFRLLRANLRYFNVDHDVRSVLITSAAPGDGKSTVAWSLASAAAGAGVRTLLIEADLRRPSLGPALGLAHNPGLSTVLAGEASVPEVLQQVFVADRGNGRVSRRTMDVLLSGPLPPNPSDLVESDRMHGILREAEHRYEFVVIDTPPTSHVSDAIPLVTQVGGVIVVGRLGRTHREAAMHLHKQLEHLDAPTLGVVVNAVGRGSASYSYGYGYYG